MIPIPVEAILKSCLEKRSGKPEKFQKIVPLSGGCINHAYKIQSTSGNYFFKWNLAGKYPGMFDQEASGLKLLRNAGEIYIPEVICHESDSEYSLIVLEYIESTNQSKNFWNNFGIALARMHKHSGDSFGLSHSNYIGSMVQYNDTHDNWCEFFINMRLQVQIKHARDKGLIDIALIRRFENLYTHLPDFFPVEKPSLLHGDLWSGNYMTNSHGEACIIDPAVYYGHRLMDIGMSRLFGGFNSDFYDAYLQEFTLEKNWIKAADIANLYPLMVHVNLFGSSYTGSVKNILSAF
jgi:protein-ribulosamine 3-kinase